jgi:hypothetical protein
MSTTARGGKRTARRPKVGGPFLISAVLCEKILTDKDGVASLIRIVDRFYVDVDEIPTAIRDRVGLSAWLHVNFKSGDARGKKTLKVKPVSPSGEVPLEIVTPIVFEGGPHGQSIHAELTMAVKEEGVYWLEVYLDDTLYTKTPLHVVFRKRAEATAETRTVEKKQKSSQM